MISKAVGLVLGALFSMTVWTVGAQSLNVKQLTPCQNDKATIGATVINGSFLGWHRQSDVSTVGIDSPDSLKTQVRLTSPTAYIATAQFEGENLIQNGDFELDSTASGIPSKYSYRSKINGAGQFSAHDSTNSGRTSHTYARINDHTKGDGNGVMMLVDGDSNPNLTSVLYYRIPVVEGDVYTFSVWIANIHESLLKLPLDTSVNKMPRLQFRIDSQSIGIYNFSPDSLWHNFSATWTCTKTDTIHLDLVDLQLASKANDFALDDIKFNSSYTIQAAITVESCQKSDVFSPDGDGVLDTYYIDEAGTAKIYDLDGNLVRELPVPAHWDGTKRNGTLADAGYYAVVINNSKSYRVSLMR
jgi:hypothetical protein